ncbi:hypothetical protein V8B55DRAFT_1439124 [Mucor lusitanicus]
MSLVFTRQLHYKRLPNYNGWWTQILKQATNPIEQSMQEPAAARQKVPLPIPFAEVIEPTQPIVTNWLRTLCVGHVPGRHGGICSEEKEIKKQFLDAGEPLPRELDPANAVDDAVEEMDPTMKAFLEMEKKLNSK